MRIFGRMMDAAKNVAATQAIKAQDAKYAEAYQGYNAIYENAGLLHNKMMLVEQKLEYLDNMELEELTSLEADVKNMSYKTAMKLQEETALCRAIHDFNFPHNRDKPMFIFVPNESDMLLQPTSMKALKLSKDAARGIYTECTEELMVQELEGLSRQKRDTRSPGTFTKLNKLVEDTRNMGWTQRLHYDTEELHRLEKTSHDS